MHEYFEELYAIENQIDLYEKFVEKFAISYRNKGLLSKADVIHRFNEKSTFFSRAKGVYANRPDVATYLEDKSMFHFGLESGVFFYRDMIRFLEPKDRFGYQHRDVFFEDMLAQREVSIEGNSVKFKSMFDGYSADASMKFLTQPTFFPCLPGDIKILEWMLEEWANLNKYKSDKSFQQHLKDVGERKRLALEHRAEHAQLVDRLDADDDGEADLVSNTEFRSLLQAKQKDIVSIDRLYVQNFVKISSYLAAKEAYIQKTYQTLNTLTYPFWSNDTNQVEYAVIERQTELWDRVHDLKMLSEEICNYHALLFHAINMVSALVDDNMLVFYELYEIFDQLGVFNSQWQNDVTKSLSQIRDGISDLEDSLWALNTSIKKMEINIVDSIDRMNFSTQQSFQQLNKSVDTHLRQINSTLTFNTLLSLVNTYDLYRINKNTRFLR